MRRVAVVGFLLAVLAACSPDSADLGRGDAVAGEVVYQANCAGCHGSAGEGAAEGPPLVHEMYAEAVFSDEAFVAAVRTGASTDAWDFPLMPAMPGLSATDVSDVLAYVRSLQAAQEDGT
jgi:mono/diheme cytochrome c family protein